MSSRLKTLVSLIQTITDQTVEQVAKSINYTRTWLTTEMGKEVGNPILEKLLADKYRNDISNFFQEGNLLLQEDPAEYGTKIKIVDAEQLLVQDSLLIKGMLRVILRNQASLIADQKNISLKKVLLELTKAVRAETEGEFGEL